LLKNDVSTICPYTIIGAVYHCYYGSTDCISGVICLDKRQTQHSVLRNFPLLGRIRYFFEMMGPEMRQYMFDSDNEGKPFTRVDFQNIVIAGKYLKTLIAFGSKRDFSKPGLYIRNSMFPKLAEEMRVVCAPKIQSMRYVGSEGLFSRKEELEEVQIQPWLLQEEMESLLVLNANTLGIF
jgi:glutamate synthase (ferredoxin)